MKIHPLWYICILIRSLFILLTYYSHKNNLFTNHINIIIFIIGSGFLYKSLYGSNNETQISKVFWHETRILHSITYLLSSYYLFNGDINITISLLLLDLLISISYRIIYNK